MAAVEGVLIIVIVIVIVVVVVVVVVVLSKGKLLSRIISSSRVCNPMRV